MARKIEREIVVLYESGGLAAISSQSYIFYNYNSDHTKGESWKSFINAVTQRF